MVSSTMASSSSSTLRENSAIVPRVGNGEERTAGEYSCFHLRRTIPRGNLLSRRRKFWTEEVSE